MCVLFKESVCKCACVRVCFLYGVCIQATPLPGRARQPLLSSWGACGDPTACRAHSQAAWAARSLLPAHRSSVLPQAPGARRSPPPTARPAAALESRACHDRPGDSPHRPIGAAPPPRSSAPSEAPQSPGSQTQTLPERGHRPGRGAVKGGEQARAAALAEPNRLPSGPPPILGRGHRQEDRPGKPGLRPTHSPLHSPAGLDARTEGGLPVAAAPRRSRSGRGRWSGRHPRPGLWPGWREREGREHGFWWRGAWRRCASTQD